MSDVRDIKACTEGDLLVSYIYNELAGTDRVSFEDHLAACDLCADDLAAVSLARYSVYEYQKVEFAPLATPSIVIPSVRPEYASDTSWAASVGAFLNGWRVPLAAAAVLVVALTAYMLSFRNAVPEQPMNASIPAVEGPSAAPVTKIDDGTAPVPVADESRVASRPVSTAKLVVTVRKTTRRSITERQPERPATFAVQQPAPVTDRTPVLTNYDETDDRSLRLSDLFENEVSIR